MDTTEQIVNDGNGVETQAEIPSENQIAVSEAEANKTQEELDEEYKVKADELESRLDRLEGRHQREEALARWFEDADSDVTVRPLQGKGMGMVSRRAVEANKLIMVCPPYVCVPYEPRKMFVCAYCFREFKYLEEQYHAAQAASQASNGAQNQTTNPTDTQSNPNVVDSTHSTNNDHHDHGNANQDHTHDHHHPEDMNRIDPQTFNLSHAISHLTVPNDSHEHQDPEHNQIHHAESISVQHVTSNEESKSQIGNPPPEVPPMPESIIRELTQCPKCTQVWYCNEECLQLDYEEHRQYECEALSRFDIPWAKSYYSYCDDLVTDIRLLIRAMNKRKWQLGNSITEFDDEYQLLISNMSCYSPDVLASLRSIVQYTNYLLPDPACLTDEELLEVYCKHRVNMFGLWAQDGQCVGYGVYPRASYFNHSCWPNTTFFKNAELKVPHMNFLTVWPIEFENDEVCISYVDISVGLRDRRSTLLDKYFFHCKCDRCMLQETDPQAQDPYYIYWVQDPQTANTEIESSDTANIEETAVAPTTSESVAAAPISNPAELVPTPNPN